MQLSEQEILRREKLRQLRELGIEPYPAALYPVSNYAKLLKDEIESVPDLMASFDEVCLAGRVMSMRDMGKASFAEIQDSTGRIQVYVRKDDICTTSESAYLYDTVFKKLLDLGDFIGVKGFLFRTKTGELSIHVREFTFLSKAIRPLPIVKRDEEGNVFDEVTDPEFRYRQRYADLVVNPHIKDVFEKRAEIYRSLRDFFDNYDFLEVETPILQAIPGGASARPFITHHNALDIPLYMRIANELYLKRLIVAGFEGVYEFSKDFRNEGMDRTHNPEFTVMEIYAAYKDYNWMMDFTEEMLEKIALDLHKTTEITVADKKINFKRPFARLTMREAILKYSDNKVDIGEKSEEELRTYCKDFHIETTPAMGKGKLIDELFGEICESHLIQPTFITDYPIEMSPLCKKHRENPELTERFELIVNGKELCNAYSELNDPIDQLERFQEQMKLSQKGDDEAMFIDLDFVRALEYGMPPTSGMGMGMDRLTMLMTNQHSIQDVLFFPQMRPEKKNEQATTEEYTAIGVREELIPILQKLGFLTIDELKKANPNKLLNDIGGMRKKMKLEVKAATKEEIEGWLD
jgi:lysyl-tRNA synthetase class 2